jgi:hypothetical protein
LDNKENYMAKLTLPLISFGKNAIISKEKWGVCILTIFKLIIRIFGGANIVLAILNIVIYIIIFKYYKEKIWKVFIPIYNTYILYKHTWNNDKIFLIPTLSLAISSFSLSKLKRIVLNGGIGILSNLIKKQELLNGLDINGASMLTMTILFLGFILLYLIFFIFQRITFWRVGSEWNGNIVLKVGIIFLPQIFLLFIYILYCLKKIKGWWN